MSSYTHTKQQEIWLIGISTGHSVAPVFHTYIAKELGLPWTYIAKEFASLEDCVQNLRTPACAGAAVTMPWKTSIMPFLDEVDECARTLNACNSVASDPNGRLVASNTDWRGIAGALQEGVRQGERPEQSKASSPATALIIGAGGAARAAVYALWHEMGCAEIYILNRDDEEVVELDRDMHPNLTPQPPRLIHVKTSEQAASLQTPRYAIGTVPDFEPLTHEERLVKDLFNQIISGSNQGIFLDMCYKPRRTRHIQIAEKAGWQVVEGWHVVGHQAEFQWRVWAGEDKVQGLENIKEGMWRTLTKTVEESPAINF